jgi:hypothetical protein
VRLASKAERTRWLGFWLAAAGVTIAGACSTSTFSSAGCEGDSCAGSGGSSGKGGGAAGRGGRSSGGASGSGTGGSDPGAGRGGGAGKGGSGGSGGSSAGKTGSGATSGRGGSDAGGTDNGGTGGTDAGGTNGGGAAGSASGNGGNGGNGGKGGAGTGGGGPAGGNSAAGVGGGPAGGGGVGGSQGGGGGVGGGVGGAGGLGIAGGPVIGDFPSTSVLDDFNRSATILGSNWHGSTGNYSLANQRVLCAEEYCPGVFWHQSFGMAQEVFATLVAFDASSPEVNLVLKAQGDPDCDMIEILFSPSQQQVLVEACSGSSWYSLGTIDATLVPGDQLGARARSDYYVEVYRNGSLLGIVSAGGYPYISLPGYIGINGVVVADGSPNVWDDFGGGGL